MSVQNYKYTILSPPRQVYNMPLKILPCFYILVWLIFPGASCITQNDMHIIFVTPKTNSCHCKKREGFEPWNSLRAHQVSHSKILLLAQVYRFQNQKLIEKKIFTQDYFLHRLLFCDYDDEESYWFYVEIFGREREEARATTRFFFFTFDNWFMR